jgi:hypothetical protein
MVMMAMRLLLACRLIDGLTVPRPKICGLILGALRFRMPGIPLFEGQMSC